MASVVGTLTPTGHMGSVSGLTIEGKKGEYTYQSLRVTVTGPTTMVLLIRETEFSGPVPWMQTWPVVMR